MPDNRYDRTRLCRPFAVFAGGMLALIVPALTGSAYAIDQPVGAANETIFARKILMDSINNNMDELETMVGSSGGINLAEGREHAGVLAGVLDSGELQLRVLSLPLRVVRD